MSSFKELKLFCRDTYCELLEGLPDGWERITIDGCDFFVDEDNGFGAGAYLDREQNKVVLVFRGTQPIEIEDIWNDLDLANGYTPTQYNTAKVFLSRVKVLLTEEGISEPEFILTGHSLGGGLAQLVGGYTQYKTVTFNAVGMDQLLNNVDLTGC